MWNELIKTQVSYIYIYIYIYMCVCVCVFVYVCVWVCLCESDCGLVYTEIERGRGGGGQTELCHVILYYDVVTRNPLAIVTRNMNLIVQSWNICQYNAETTEYRFKFGF